MRSKIVATLAAIIVCSIFAIAQVHPVDDVALLGKSPSKLPAAGPATLQFQLAEYLSGGPVPSGIAAADFNRDGYLDIVAVNTGVGGSSQGNLIFGVLLNNGDGTFAPAASYSALSTPVYAVYFAVGDFHGKGPDILFSYYGGQTLSMLPNKGNGTFGSPKVIEKFPCYTMAVGDFNRDGKLDLACIASNGLNIMLGNGNGTFQTPVVYPTGGVSIAVADLRKNGKLDLIIPGGTGSVTQIFSSVSVLLGNGDGTFQPPVGYTVLTDPTSAVVGDFNGDGKLDLAVLNTCLFEGACGISMLLGNGDGTFQPEMIPWISADGGSLVAADFTGDGLLDLAVIGTIFINTPGTNAEFPTQQSFATVQGPTAMVAGRFGPGGNGSADLAFADWNSEAGNSVTVMLNQAATIIVLESTPNPSNSGQSVEFSATVGAAVPGAGSPTGTITFMNGTHKLGTSKLINGVAVLPYKKMTAGTNNITAVYSGDNTFNPDTSAVLVQTVN